MIQTYILVGYDSNCVPIYKLFTGLYYPLILQKAVK